MGSVDIEALLAKEDITKLPSDAEAAAAAKKRSDATPVAKPGDPGVQVMDLSEEPPPPPKKKGRGSRPTAQVAGMVDELATGAIDKSVYDGSNPERLTSADLPAADDPAWDMPLVDEAPARGYVIPAGLERARAEDKQRELGIAQEATAALPAPDVAADLRTRAHAKAVPFSTALADPKTVEPKESPLPWSNYANNEPLSDILLNPEKSVLVQDEAERLAHLAGFDKDAPASSRVGVALEAGSLGLEESRLWTKKGMNGGTLSPEDEAKLKSIEARLLYMPQPQGMLDEVIGVLPMVGGTVAAAAGGAALGAAPGLAVPGLAPVGAALGARAGAFAYNADLLIGQNYSQYTKMGMPHDVAWPAALIAGSVAAGIDTITFGLLAKIPSLGLISKIPGAELLNKTNIGPAMVAALKDSTFKRVLAGVTKDVAVGGTGNALQEAVGILGAYAANTVAGGQYQTPTAEEAAARVFHAAKIGGVIGGAFGGASTLFHEAVSKVAQAEKSKPVIAKLYAATEDLKSAERAPDVLEKYGKDLAERGSVKYLTMPLEDLQKLLDTVPNSAATKAWLARPEVRRQFTEAQANGTRIAVPLGEFIAYIRPLDKSKALLDVIGLNDAMSAAEAKELSPAIRKARQEMQDIEARRKFIENSPESMIVADLEKKLRAANMTAEAARIQGEFVASGIATLARRTKQEPWEMYQKAAITIERRDFTPEEKAQYNLKDDVTNLGVLKEQVAELRKKYADDYNLRPEWRNAQKAYNELRAKLEQGGKKIPALYDANGKKVEALGAIFFDPNVRDTFKIVLTGKASLATFVHESSHYLLEVMRKYGDHEGVADMLKTLEDWAGVKDGNWDVPALEKFARGMETYLGEGRAPSAKLAGVFATVKSYILHVYRTLTRLGAPLTDEVRAVMDRMLATDEEIGARRAELGYFPNDVLMRDGDMTPERIAQYQEMYAKGAQQAQLKLDLEAIAAVKREKTADYKRVAAEVEKELDSHPVLSLRAWLAGGDRTDGGLPLTDWATRKLNKDLVVEKGITGSLTKLKEFLTEHGGIDPEELAPFFQFKNGTELISALTTTPARSTLKSAMTKAEFTKIYPAYGPDPSWVERTALARLHESDAISNALELELRTIYKKAELQPPESPALVARLAAKETVQEMSRTEMRPAIYRDAETRMLREQQQALAAKDFKAAAEATRRRLYNRAMWQEVERAVSTIDTAKKYAVRFTSEDMHARIGRSSEMELSTTGERAGFVIRDAVKALTEEVGLTEQTAASLDSTFEAHLSKLEGAGLPVSIEPILRDRPLKVWEDLSLLQVVAVRDALKNLSTVARGLDSVRLRDQAIRLNDVADQLIANLKESKLLGRLGDEGAQKSTLRNWRAQAEKPETTVLDLDGGKIGVLHKLLIQSAEQGQFERDRRFRMRRDDLNALTKSHQPKGWKKLMQSKFEFVDGHSYTGEEVFAMLLNFGTASNRDKLIRGMERAGRTGWTEDSVLEFIHRVFPDRAAYDYAQEYHRYLSRPDLWDDAAKIREQMAGVRPEKVEPLAIPTPDGGSIEGGYYPLIYNRMEPLKDVELRQADALDAMHDANPLNLYAANGFTKGRTNYAAPLLLKPDALAAHLYEVDHFISHAQGIVDRHKILNHPRVKEAIVHAIGWERWEGLRQSNNYIAADGRQLTREFLQLSSTIDKLIFNNALLSMGGNVLSGVNQVVMGVPATLTYLGPKGTHHFASALIDFLKNPFQAWKDVSERSGEIQDMDLHYDRDLRLVVRRGMTGESWDHIRSRIASTTMAPIVFGQKMVNVITFMAAERSALKEGKSNADAVAYAHSVVRQSQSTSAPKDLTAIQRSKDGLARILTTLASYQFTLNDMVMPRRMTQDQLVGHVSRLIMLTLTTAVAKSLFDVLTPKLEEKDAERRKGISKMAQDAEFPGLLPVWEGFASVIGNVPIVGRPAESLLTGREPRFASWVDSGIRAMSAAPDAFAGKDLSKAKLKAVVDTIGLLSGVPTRHVLFAPGEFGYELLQGNIEDSPGAFFQELALARPGQKGDGK